jgi:predicted enzyme related to lactoylglutathione lyase
MALSTSDIAGATEFYTRLFGWTVAYEGMFGVFVKDGEAVASFIDQAMQPGAHDQPPNWMPFVRVSRIEEVTDRAGSLGGRVWIPVFEAVQSKVSLISGLTREILGLWESPVRPEGPVMLVPPGVAAWFELVTPNPEPAKKYYADLFGWRFDSEGTYTVITNGSHSIAGVLKMEGDWEDHAFLEAIGQAPGEKWEVPPHWMVFLHVDDVEQVASRAESLGGRILARPDTLHTFGQFAVLRDPQNAYFSIFSRS